MKPSGSIRKEPTGIQGLDEITGGGLPAGRPTLVVGGPGSGKTLLAISFLVNGAEKYDEPGVFVTFEEPEKALIENCASLGYDLKKLIAKKKLALDYVFVEPEKIIETGEYDLEGLFIRIGHAIDSVHAKRIALDTLETIFSSFGHQSIIRSEMSRLFRYLKDRGVTAVVTSEAGQGTLSRHGLEEYISDMVISLDHRVNEESATRRLRIVKYRGSSHGTNEYPFLIDADGITVIPITSVGLIAKASRRRISSGVPDLDKMLGGKGFYEGSTILVSGGAGTGKTSIAAQFALRACRDGKKVLYLVFEESADQITRNMRSIGLDLAPLLKSGKLMIRSSRPSAFGLEMHLSQIHRIVDKERPDVVIFDPITALVVLGTTLDVKHMLLRTVDYLKMQGTTVLLTELRDDTINIGGPMISSLADTWIVLDSIELNGEKNRLIRVIKSRGMSHSNQVREMILTDDGVKVVRPHVSSGGVLTGTARYVQEMKELDDQHRRASEIDKLRSEMRAAREKMTLQMKAMKVDLAAKEAELVARLETEARMRNGLVTVKKEISRRRAGSGRRGNAP